MCSRAGLSAGLDHHLAVGYGSLSAILGISNFVIQTDTKFMVW